MPSMLFYVQESDGSVSGPHLVPVLARRLETGAMGWNDLVCAQGTEDWVPASVYEDMLDSAGRQRREQEAQDRRHRTQIMAMMGEQKDKAGKLVQQAWTAGLCFFVMGLACIVGSMIFSFPLLALVPWITGLCGVLCGMVLMANGALFKGAAVAVLGILTLPILIVWVVRI